MNDEHQVVLEKIWRAAAPLRASALGSEAISEWILGIMFFRWLTAKAGTQHTSGLPLIISEKATWDFLSAGPRELAGRPAGETFGLRLREAIRIIEHDNPVFEGTFSRVFASPEPGEWGSIKKYAERLDSLFLSEPYLKNQKNVSRIFAGLIHRLALDLGHFATVLATPPAIQSLMVRLAAPKAEEKICDPLCGTGGFLAEIARYLKDTPELQPAIYGQASSASALCLATMNLLLAGAEPHLFQSDALSEQPRTDPGNPGNFDLILTNPPFSQRVREIKSAAYRPGTERLLVADYLFIQKIVALLNDHGRAATVAPLGVLFRKGAEQHIRQQLVEEDLFEAVIRLPPGMFYGTLIPACILILKKQKAPDRKKKILFIDASKVKVDSGWAKSFSEKSIDEISAVFQGFQEVPHFSRTASLEEIRAAEYDLSVDHYVKAAAISYRPSKEVLQELNSLQKEQAALLAHLERLGPQQPEPIRPTAKRVRSIEME